MVDDLKPYPAYKPSGVDWLGDVPERWDIKPGFAAYRAKQTKNTGMVEKTVLSLSYGRIVVKPSEKLHGLVPASFETYQIVDPGDIIIRPTDLQNDWNSLRVGLSRHRGIITSAYLCLATDGVLTTDYGYYLLHAYDLMKIFYGMGSGLRQNLDFSDLKRMTILVPPLDEQAAIVRFLDHMDARTRRYIQAKRRLIALLTEQKQAIIHQAVTQGLDPSAPRKPSGVAWLGDIPAHWRMIRAKYLFREVDERSETGNEELLSVSHITGVTPRSQKTISMFLAANYAGHKVVQTGDLAINTMWAWMGALGIARQMGIVSPSYGTYRLLPGVALDADYLDGLLRIKPYIDEYIRCSTGIHSSRLRLYPETFLRIPIVYPPLNEQRTIADFFREQLLEVEAIIQRTLREIDLIREYRTRLIADVVTGQLDVRGVALPALDDLAGAGEELLPLEMDEEAGDKDDSPDQEDED